MKRADFLKGALYLALAARAPLAWGQEEGQYGVETDLPAIDGELSDFVRSLPAVHFGHKGGYRIGVGWFEVG